MISPIADSLVRHRLPSSSHILATFRHAAPSPLFELYTLRETLKETWKSPKDLLDAIKSASAGVDKARDNYQRTFAAPRELCDAARQQLYVANAALNCSAMEAEHFFLERQEIWNRIVRLLRGESFFAPYTIFESDVYRLPEMATLPFVDPPPVSVQFW